MSLILDALRRADAERQRAQPVDLARVAAVPQPSGKTPSQTRDRRWGLGLVMLSLIAGAGAGLWWAAQRTPPALPAALSVVTAAPAIMAASTAPPLPPQAALLPPQTPPPLPAAPVPPSALGPIPTAPPPPAQPPAQARTATPPPKATARSRPPPAGPAPTLQASDDMPAPLSALSERERAPLSGLTFGGAVHSEDRTQSFVLRGAEILREGSMVTPGVMLERIEPRSLVLRLGERRVRLPL